MRAFVLATVLLASSSLCSFAQEQEKAPAGGPQAGTPAQTDQISPPPSDQKADRDQPKADDREKDPDGKMHRGDGERTGRDDRAMAHCGMMGRGDGDREMGRGGMMRRGDNDRMDRDQDKKRGRYAERGDRDRAGRDRDDKGYDDADRPRRRMKICIEYENGDEFCRYRR